MFYILMIRTFQKSVLHGSGCVFCIVQTRIKGFLVCYWCWLTHYLIDRSPNYDKGAVFSALWIKNVCIRAFSCQHGKTWYFIGSLLSLPSMIFWLMYPPWANVHFQPSVELLDLRFFASCRCSTFPSKHWEKQIALERSLILTLVLVYIFFLLVDLKGGDRRPEKGRGWSNL